MPYYSELGLTSLPSSSAYSSLFLSGPYSNHSSIIASNILPPSLSKPLPRQFRGGYKPHLSTISEFNTPRRINSPKLLYHTSPKVNIRPIKKINTADIDVSVNKYKKYEKYEKPKTENVEKEISNKAPGSKSLRNSQEEKVKEEKIKDEKIKEAKIKEEKIKDEKIREEKVAKPNRIIRRDRPTVRLQTVHKDTLQEKIGAIKSWRDNFKPEELDGRVEGAEARRAARKKTPGEILKEKFLIRSRSKENILKEPKKISRKASVKKSPSFQEICEAITSENIDEELNPGQPEEVQRKQSRQIPNGRILKEIRRNSTELSVEDLKILDAILSEQDDLDKPTTGKLDEESFESRGSVKKKKMTKKKSNDNLILDENKKFPNNVKKSHSKEKINQGEIASSPIQRRPTKKRLRTPSIEQSVEKVEKKFNPLIEQMYQNVIRDISQVEIEQTHYKPKPVITGIVEEIEEAKPTLKAIIDEVEVEEAPKKKEKKFRFNVTVQVEEKKPKPPKAPLNKGVVQLPKGKGPIISSILTKKSPVHNGKILEDDKNIIKKPKLMNTNENKTEVIKSDNQKPEDIPIPIIPEKKENNLLTTTDSEEQNVLASNMSEGHEVLNQTNALPTSPITKDDNLRSPAPFSPITNKNNFFNKDINERPGSPLSYSKNFFSKDWPKRPESPLSPISKEKVLHSSTPSPKTSQKFLFNKDLTQRPESPLSSVTKETDSTPASPVSTKKELFNKVTTERPESSLLSPTTKLKNFSKDFPQRPESPLSSITKETDSTPASPVATKKELSNKDTFKRPDSPHSPTTKVKNFFNKLNDTPPTSPTPSSPLSKRRELFKKERTPPTSPLLQKNNMFNKDKETPPNSPITKEEIFFIKVDQEPINNTPLTKDKEEKIPEIPAESRQSVEVVKKDENDNMIFEDNKEETVEPEDESEVITAQNKKLISKRSLVQKANKDDPDLEIFVPPGPEPEPEPEPEPATGGFVPLQSNRLSQFMNPWKKPEQFDVCPVEIFARPKLIRGRHYPRPRAQPVPAPKEESSSEEEDDDDEDESEEETSTEEETSEEESEENMVNKIGASTSSNDSGFGSGAPGRNKGSLESRDSPTSNHANNPAFALDSGDIPEEYSQSSTFTGFQKSGRITPPATTIPRFRKYCVDDFNFLKVLGKGSFGKVLLAELKGTEYYYAIKCLKKDVVLEDDDVECTLIERKVLALGTKHPYLCHLLCTFQTESHLFFVMEYLNGGDLMFHIQASGSFPEHQARFYGAEIVSGLKFLHNKGIVYRDLKLDNVLLDFDGHVRIADFGMCKLQIFLDRMAETFCGTPDYMAPEIIKGLHYNQNVDWWSFGVLLYEMLLGQSPFSGCDEDELFWSICNEKPVLPRFLSAEATNILTLLLEKDATKRLGNRFSPHGDIQDQPFFKPIDWHALEARQMESPFKPNLQHPLDTQYFDKHFTVEKAKLTPIDAAILQSMDQTQFQGFSYTNPNATDK